MGRKFASQISEIDHRQLYWVPRAKDENGGGEQGGILVMQPYFEQVLFDALQIRNTTAQPSKVPSAANTNPESAYDQVYGVYKTAVFINTMDQAVTIQPTWSRDGENFYPFGSTQTVPAVNGTTPGTAVVPLSTDAQYLPYVGVTATCSTAPTLGDLSGWLEQLG